MNKKPIIACLCIVLLCACGKKQEVIFEAKSISYKRGDSIWLSEMEKECAQISKELSGYMKDGWRVVTSSPKEIPVGNNHGMCVGTEYIIEK